MLTRAGRPPARGLPRERLSRRPLEGGRVRVVVGPAGSGKSTLLSQLVAGLDMDGASFSARHWVDSYETAVEDITGAVGASVNGTTHYRDIGARVSRSIDRPVYLAVDDIHLLDGSDSDRLLGELAENGPPDLTVVVASRTVPRWNLPRLRVAGDLVEIDADDLRFRPWEVDELFRDFYGEPLTPGDIALLTNTTKGWAAVLQLFHLAVAGKDARGRRSVLADLGRSFRPTREYLARNVMLDLPDQLRNFLVETSVLGILTGSLCDELLGRKDSAAQLEELVRRALFTTGEGGTYRYHDVLRSHLEVVLADQVGEAVLRERYSAAGALLEDHGAPHEALHAYLRAEDVDAARRLLLTHRVDIAEMSIDWIDNVASSLARDDPWLVLASARRHRAAGRIPEAINSYREAHAGFGGTAPSDVCSRERLVLGAWQDPRAVGPRDWSGTLRAAAIRHPAAARKAAASIPGAHGLLVSGVAALAEGAVDEAAAVLQRACDADDATDSLAVAARLARACALFFAGDEEATREAEAAFEGAEKRGLPWLSGIAQSLVSATRGQSVNDAHVRLTDPVGGAISRLLLGFSALSHSSPSAASFLECARDTLHGLGLGTLESWAAAGLALALVRSATPGAREAALQAEALARATGVRGAQAFGYLALAETAASTDTGLLDASRALAAGCGIALPLLDEQGAASEGWRVRCFGSLEIEVDGAPLEFGAVKPRARQVLRMLVLHAPHAVHREVLVEALWHDVPPAQGRRGLHVAISSLRHDLAQTGADLVVKDGDSYRVALPEGSVVDLIAFRAATLAGDDEAALSLYRGDLFEDDGPAEWVVGEREQCRSDVVAAAVSLAKTLLATDPGDAVRACEQGLAVDRYRDELWRLLVKAHSAANNPAAAALASRRYKEVLRELGVEGSV